MTITLLPNHPTKYQNAAQAVKHLAKYTRGRPFQLKLEHMGRVQINDYSGTGDFIRSTI